MRVFILFFIIMNSYNTIRTTQFVLYKLYTNCIQIEMYDFVGFCTNSYKIIRFLYKLYSTNSYKVSFFVFSKSVQTSRERASREGKARAARVQRKPQGKARAHLLPRPGRTRLPRPIRVHPAAPTFRVHPAALTN
jgi:hypothetical protein